MENKRLSKRDISIWNCWSSRFEELSGLSEKDVERILTIVITGTQKIQRIDGSFEESYPYESSYCVTSLLFFSTLYIFLNTKNILIMNQK